MNVFEAFEHQMIGVRMVRLPGGVRSGYHLGDEVRVDGTHPLTNCGTFSVVSKTIGRGIVTYVLRPIAP